MTEATIDAERPTGGAGYALLTGAQVEQALVAAIEKLERAGSPVELAEAIGKLASLKQEKGSYSEAEELFRKVLSIREQVLGYEHIELVDPLKNVAAARILGGAPQAAEAPLARALAISSRYLGEDHPDLTIMVNDFARLYLNQGAYALADPLLQRLLKIKRAKGDDHPEVATVIASIAAVRQATGQNEVAEDLWRRVLAIRERTLSPNHFTQATAVEHLAEVCSARGKSAEALQLFQRAHSIREQTLGSGHPSLIRLRERIADLQLQTAEDSFETSDLTPNGSYAVFPQRSTRQTFGSVTSRTGFESSPVSPDASYRLQEQRFSPISSTPALDPILATQEEREAAAAAYRASLIGHRTDLDDEDEETQPGLLRRIAESVSVLAFRHHRELLAVGGVLAFFVVAFAASSRASTENDQIAEIPLRESATGPITPVARPLATAVSATADPVRIGTSESSSFLRRTIPSKSKVEPREAEKTPSRKREQSIIVVPVVSTNMSLIDSLSRVLGSRVGGVGDVAPTVPAFGLPGLPHSKFGAPEKPVDPPTSRARLIGTLPNPRTPAHMEEPKGEVLVRFTVDTNGVPVMSTFSAVHSENPVLTESVRAIIAGLRFEPARDAGPGSKAVTDEVEIKYVFRPKN